MSLTQLRRNVGPLGLSPARRSLAVATALMLISGAVVLALGAAPPAGLEPLSEEQAEEGTEKRIEKRYVVRLSGDGSHDSDCEGEDCDEVHRVIVVDGEGKIEIKGDGLGDKHVIRRLGKHGGGWDVKRMGFGRGPMLGIQLTDLTAELRAHFGVPESEGVLVARVVEGSPAEQAGIVVGDIIAQVDGDAVGSSRALVHLLRSREVGETVAIQFYRDGGLETATASLGERPKAQMHRTHRAVVVCDEGEDCEEPHVLNLLGAHLSPSVLGL